jgi:hypothetical protein
MTNVLDYKLQFLPYFHICKSFVQKCGGLSLHSHTPHNPLNLCFQACLWMVPVSQQLLLPPRVSIVSEPGSSVSIVSGYGLDDRAIEVRSPVEAKGFFL